MVVSWYVWHQTKKSSCLGPLSCLVACCRVVSCRLCVNWPKSKISGKFGSMFNKVDYKVKVTNKRYTMLINFEYVYFQLFQIVFDHANLNTSNKIQFLLIKLLVKRTSSSKFGDSGSPTIINLTV